MNRLGAARYPVLGLTAVVVAIGIAVMAVAVFSGTFGSKVEVSVDTDRVGLLMAPKDRVLVDGVAVGYVDAIAPRSNGARLTVALDPGQIDVIPSDVVPTIDATTVFGPKVVSLHRRAISGSGHIVAGTVLTTTGKATEINDVFEQLVRVLDAVDPAELDAVLGETASAVRGRGGQIGDLIGQLNALLTGLNPSLPAVQKDLQRAAPVLNSYADVTPRLARLLGNLAGTSATIASKQGQLAALLLGTTRFSNDTRTFLATNEHALGLAVEVLAPTSRLFARYSPMFPCFLQGLDHNRQLLEKVVGGNGKSTGINLAISPSMAPYHAPADLPRVAADSGPSCANLPISQLTPSYHPGETGTNPKAGADHPTLNEPLAVYLFGDQSPFRAQAGR